MNFPTLYHKSKTGKLVSWKIWTEDEYIVTEYGQVDGKKQTATKIALPKNVGKVNETTGPQQAELEAMSMHKHRLDRKYSLTPETAETEEVFLPMLAYDFEKQKKKMEYPAYVQPKLDGVRCLAHWGINDEGNQEVKLTSRGGKEYSVPHIQKALEKIIPHDRVFDGEIYIHGETLQSINRLVKKFRPGKDGTERLQYHVYDQFTRGQEDQVFSKRSDEVAACFVLATYIEADLSSIKFVKTEIVDSEEEVYEKMRDFMLNGYEGAIIRRPEGKYELGYRSRDLLKAKTFQDAEFTIVGHEFGVGRADKSVTWFCEQEEGLTFKVVPRGTIEQREKWGSEAEKYYGKKLTVKFQNRTEDNIPQFPVGLAIRLDEDLGE